MDDKTNVIDNCNNGNYTPIIVKTCITKQRHC